MDSIAISILVAIVVVLGVFYYFSRNPQSATTSTTIKGPSIDGKQTFDSMVELPKSVNEKEGLTFAYTCWLKINDFAYRYGEQKVVFVKGPSNLSSVCPALLIDANTNSLIVKIDTFGATEVIPISNIPAKKWLHFALVVEQNSVDVYINGTLHTHHTLMQLPRQNSESVHTGVAGGFEGVISSLTYYNNFLTGAQIQSIMKSGPLPGEIEVLPPYFDISWWTRAS
jgi:Concanavalin A-like lectin/glucanases superfamily